MSGKAKPRVNDPDTVYRSEPKLHQQKFEPQRRTTRYRVSLESADKWRRQSTLTQLEFGQATPRRARTEDDDDELDEEWEEQPHRKRRRKDKPERKRQTTLTQMPLVRKTTIQDSEDEDEIIVIDDTEDERHNARDVPGADPGMAIVADPATDALAQSGTDELVDSLRVPSSQAGLGYEEQDQEEGLTIRASSVPSPPKVMQHELKNAQTSPTESITADLPATPQFRRDQEIPSSRSPVATPYWTQRSRRFLQRSPLSDRSINVDLDSVPETPTKVRFSSRSPVVRMNSAQVRRYTPLRAIGKLSSPSSGSTLKQQRKSLQNAFKKSEPQETTQKLSASLEGEPGPISDLSTQSPSQILVRSSQTPTKATSGSASTRRESRKAPIHEKQSIELVTHTPTCEPPYSEGDGDDENNELPDQTYRMESPRLQYTQPYFSQSHPRLLNAVRIEDSEDDEEDLVEHGDGDEEKVPSTSQHTPILLSFPNVPEPTQYQSLHQSQISTIVPTQPSSNGRGRTHHHQTVTINLESSPLRIPPPLLSSSPVVQRSSKSSVGSTLQLNDYTQGTQRTDLLPESLLEFTMPMPPSTPHEEEELEL